MGNLYNPFPVDLELVAKHLPELERILNELEPIPLFYEDKSGLFWRVFIELFTAPDIPFSPPDRIWKILVNLYSMTDLDDLTSPLLRLAHNNERMSMAIAGLRILLDR